MSEPVILGDATLYQGDCLEVLRGLPDASVDAVVVDPPYGLSFMGRKWDYDVPVVDVWQEALRVLKPGGHMLCFAGTRTFHRMAVRIEDAGFEIRDMIAWIYGSGFPKSLDVSKAIDKAAGEKREVSGPNKFACLNGKANSNCYGKASRPDATVPATEAACQWQGWGTALKPAHEPIALCRKPLDGTVAQNVLKHGVGGLNVDGCRVPVADDQYAKNCAGRRGHAENRERAMSFAMTAGSGSDVGRFPANLIHDGSDEVVALFPGQAGAAAQVLGTESSTPAKNTYGTYQRVTGVFHGDTGSTARFFYCAKASKADRDEGCLDLPEALSRRYGEQGQGPQPQQTPRRAVVQRNTHPTVKPAALMRYLCRLITPPGGICLDPFMGSGSTGKAAMLEGFRFIGIEREPEYFDIARARIAAAKRQAVLPLEPIIHPEPESEAA